MAATVGDLFIHHFTDLPLEDQRQIVALGRPLPRKNLSAKFKSWEQLALFEQVPWLTYWESRQELFCWTCLLFMPASSRLTRRSDLNLSEIKTVTKNHETCEKHLECALRLQIFISENFIQPTPVRDKIGHNYAVIKNREILTIITDAICCLVSQKQLDGDGKYTYNMISVEDCKKFLQFLKNCYPFKAEIVDGAVYMLNRNSRVVNQLVDAITRTVKMAIKIETQKSTYVSLILSEHGSSSGKSQISSVLRYINRGKACERFIGFNNFVGVKNCTEHLDSIISTLEEFGISDRFLSLSVDGEVLSRQPLSTLISSMTAQFRYSYFVPWYSHGFGYVFLQTLSTIKECGIFLKMINGMQIFFRNENIFKSFEKHLGQKVPENYKSPDLTWNLRSNFIIFVCRYRCNLIKFFESLSHNSKGWNADITARTTAFRSFLQEFRNVFLLLLFLEIFYDDFDQNFNFPLANDVFKSDKIAQFGRKIGCLEFATVWGALEDEADYEGADSPLKSAFEDSSERENCEAMFKTIMRHLYVEIDTRIMHFQRLKFCDLFMMFCHGAGNANFVCKEHNKDLLSELMAEHGPFFNQTFLQAELKAIQKNVVFRDKGVYELLEYLAEYDLRGVFPQVFKLAEFVLTLAHLPAAGNNATSKLRVIDDFSYVPEATGIPSGEVSVLCVEYEMLKTLKDSALFYEDVLARFFEVNKTLPLVQV